MVKLPNLLIIEQTPTTETPTQSSLTPKLWWPTLNSTYEPVDLNRFPSRDEETYRYHVGEFGSCSQNFISAVGRAVDRIWIIDRYLLKLQVENNGNFFSTFEQALAYTKASDIRLLTTGKNGHEEQVRSLLGIQEARRAPPRYETFTIEVRLIREGTSPMRLPHDRFALTDDELWHWGANVGGTHRDVNAYSHGWMAGETGAMQYFQRLWDNSEIV